MTHVLLTTPHDPTVPASFVTKLLQPLKLTDILQLANESTLTLALESPSPSVNLLALYIISKARSPSDVAILSVMQPFILQLIKTWLSAESVDVGHRATEVLADLLELDSPNRRAGTLNFEMNGGKSELKAEPQGQGLLWRRIFGDAEIFGAMFDLCSGKGGLDERQRSLAQARLLRLLPRLAALDIDVLRMPLTGASDESMHVEKGMLWWASVEMVDRTDVLMHITLLDFFADLLKRLGGFGDDERVELKQAQLDFVVGLTKDMCQEDLAVAALVVELDQLEQEPEKGQWKDFVNHLRRRCVPASHGAEEPETTEILREA